MFRTDSRIGSSEPVGARAGRVGARRVAVLFVLLATLLAACGSSGATEQASPAPSKGSASSAAPSTAGKAPAASSAPASAQPPTSVPTGSTGGASPVTGTPAQRPGASASPTRQAEVVGQPVRLVIQTDKMKIDAPVESVGLTKDGAMDVPKKWEDVAWYKLGPRPGEKGNAAIAGHLDSTTGPAVFWNLKDLQPGDTVAVIDDRGRKIDFKVTKTEIYKADEAPIADIFGPTQATRLNLITCDGTFDRNQKSYDKRLVVFTERVS